MAYNPPRKLVVADVQMEVPRHMSKAQVKAFIRKALRTAIDDASVFPTVRDIKKTSVGVGQVIEPLTSD